MQSFDIFSWFSELFFKIKIRGEAESFAIHAKAKAEAEQMAKKAEAYKEYREAAMIEMLLETLPKVSDCNMDSCISINNIFFQVAAEVAAPLSQTKKITMGKNNQSKCILKLTTFF